MSTAVPTTTISLPVDLFERLAKAAKSMGLDMAAYLTFLEQCRTRGIDYKSRDAAAFMLSKHGDSLRKLAQ